MQEYLFSYGTLQQEKTQIELFGRRLIGSADILNEYKIAMIEITDKNFLAKGEEKFQKTLVHTGNKNDSVQGTAFEIRHEELLLCDKYEPGNYKRVEIKLGSGRKAWIYAVME